MPAADGLAPLGFRTFAGTVMTYLTHWGRVTHICVSKPTIVGSDNGSAPGRRQAIIWTNAGILLIGPLGTNFSEIFIKIYIFSFKKMRLKMSSGNCRPFCLGLNVLMSCIETSPSPARFYSLLIWKSPYPERWSLNWKRAWMSQHLTFNSLRPSDTYMCR